MGCAHAGGATSPATPGPAAAPPGAPVSPDHRLYEEVRAALLRDDRTEAAAIVERARHVPPSARPTAEAIAYFDATVHSYQGDFQGAAKVMHDHITQVGPGTRDAFQFHDAMIALRTADGDLVGALVECEEMVNAGTLGTWSDSDMDRMTLVRLKEHWHRAYLLRMVAQTITGAERQAFLDYAERARQAYVAVAAPLRDLRDSIAVLDAYFAFCDGDPAKMREAAQRVNVMQDDDIEDLYLVQLAFDGAGDSEAAAAVRKRMSALDAVTVLTPVFLSWMRADEATDRVRFSPKRPTGARPTQ